MTIRTTFFCCGILLSLQALLQPALAATVIGGTLDTYLEKTLVPGKSVTRLDSSGLGVSKIYVKSKENLDATTTVLAHLEGSINVDTGAAGNAAGIFDRMSYVGIQTERIKVTLGKQFSPHLLQLGGEYDVFGTSFWGTPYAIFQAGSRYTLVPGALAIQGTFLDAKNLSVSLMLANRDDQPSTRPTGKQIFLSAAYAVNKDLRMGMSLVRDHHYSFENPEMDLVLLGFNYDTGTLRFSAGFQTLDLRKTARRINEYCVGAGYWINPANQIQMTYGKTYQTGATQSYAVAYGLALIHDLSKRTALYGSVAQIRNGGGSAAYFDLPLQAGETSSNIMIGIRHNF